MSVKKRIIDETGRLFETYGLKSIRMDDIASNLGISKRTIYELFGDKETLITEWIKNLSEEDRERQREIFSKADNIVEEFMLLMKNWDETSDTRARLMENLKKFYPDLYRKIIDDHTDVGVKILTGKLKKGVEKGLLLDNINFDLAVSIFSYSVFGLISEQKMILPNGVTDKDAVKYVITYFLRGIATDKGIKMIDEFINNEQIKTKNKS